MQDGDRDLRFEISRLNQRLGEAEARLAASRALADAVELPLVLINGEGRVQAANLSAVAAYDLPEGEAVSLWEALGPALADQWMDQAAAVAREDKARKFQYDRGDRVLEVSLWPVRDTRGRMTGFGILERDVTGTIRSLESHQSLAEMEGCTASRLRHASKLINLGTLVSGLAHEISNSNAFILTNAPLLENIWNDCVRQLPGFLAQNQVVAGGLGPEEVKAYVPSLLRGITDGARRIDRIVRSLRSFSRYDSGSAFEPVCLNQVIRNCLLFLTNEISRSTHRFQTDLEQDLPRVSGIAQRLEQLVTNLILNACQSLEDPERGITVSTRSGQGTVTVLVEDQGQGIRPEHMERIFDPFFTTRAGSRGTGLGLSISRTIAEEHGGSIRITSRPGKGTRAVAEFPVQKGERHDCLPA